jgi:hypothetical protein
MGGLEHTFSFLLNEISLFFHSELTELRNETVYLKEIGPVPIPSSPIVAMPDCTMDSNSFTQVTVDPSLPARDIGRFFSFFFFHKRRKETSHLRVARLERHPS